MVEKFSRESIREAVINSYNQGQIVLPGNLQKLGNPYDFRVEDFSQKEQVINYADNLEEARNFFEEAVFNLDKFRGYLGDINFDTEKGCDLEVELDIPRCREDLDNLRLDSFYYNQKVVVKLVKSFATRLEVRLSALYFGGEVPLRFSYYSPGSFGERLGYLFDVVDEKDIEEEGGIDFTEGFDLKQVGDSFLISFIERYPVILTLNPISGAQSVSLLPYHVFLQHLEPPMSRRLLEDAEALFLERGNKEAIRGWEMHSKIVQRKYERDLVADSIMRHWLSGLEKKGRDSFKLEEILVIGSEGLKQEDAQRGFLRIDDKGVAEIVDFYSSTRWDFKRFLEGEF
jgi:hypothetical protein